MSSILNEGFLYISTDKNDKSPFIMGKIIDTTNNLVCPGEIIPIINPEYEEIESEIIVFHF